MFFFWPSFVAGGFLILMVAGLLNVDRVEEAAGFLAITKEFEGAKPRTWLQATRAGRKAYAEYLSNLEKALGLRVHGRTQSDGQAGGK